MSHSICRQDGIADNGLLEHFMATTENPHCNAPPTEVDRVVEILSSVMAKKTIDKWLATPNGAFDGLTPLEVIERGDIDRIWRMVDLLESGRP